MADEKSTESKNFLVPLKIPVGMAVSMTVEDSLPEVVRRRKLNKKVAEALEKVRSSMEVKDRLWELTQAMTRVATYSVVVVPGVMLPEEDLEVGIMIKNFCEELSKPTDENVVEHVTSSGADELVDSETPDLEE